MGGWKNAIAFTAIASDNRVSRLFAVGCNKRSALHRQPAFGAISIAPYACYGTSQRTTELHGGEFAIHRDRNPAAFRAAGPSYDTKFDLWQTVVLPYNAEWFSVPPAAPHGQKPLLGTLHPSLMRAVEAAYRASRNG